MMKNWLLAEFGSIERAMPTVPRWKLSPENWATPWPNFSAQLRNPRAPAAAKYRHSENPALTWSGRGRKPQWFVEALEAGKTASDLAIG